MPYFRYKQYIENEVGKENAQLLNIARSTIQRSPSPPYSIKKFDDTRATAEKEFVGLIFNRQVTQHLKSKWDVVDGYQGKFREDVSRMNDHVHQQHLRYEMAVHQGVKDRIANFDITSKIEKLGVVAIYYDSYKNELEEVIEFLKPCSNFLEDCCRLMNITKNIDIINRHRTLTLFKQSLVKDFSVKHLELEAERGRLRNLKDKFEHVYVQSNTLLGGLISTYDELAKDNTRIEKGIEIILSTSSAQFLQHYRKFNSIQAIYEKIQQQRMMPKETVDPMEMLGEIESRMVNMSQVVKELNAFNNARNAQHKGSGHRDYTSRGMSMHEVSEGESKGKLLQSIKQGKNRLVNARMQVEALKGDGSTSSINSIGRKKAAFRRKMSMMKMDTNKIGPKDLKLKFSIGGTQQTGSTTNTSTSTKTKGTGKSSSTSSWKKAMKTSKKKGTKEIDENVNRNRDVKATILSRILEEGVEEGNHQQQQEQQQLGSCSSSMTYSRGGGGNTKNDLMTVRDVAFFLNQDRNHSNKDRCTLSDGFGGSIGQVDIEESISGDVDDDAGATYRRAQKSHHAGAVHPDLTDGGGPDIHKLYPDNGYFYLNNDDSTSDPDPDPELSERNTERRDDINSDVNASGQDMINNSYPNDSDSDVEINNVNANMLDSDSSLSYEKAGYDTSISYESSDKEDESQGHIVEQMAEPHVTHDSDIKSQRFRTKDRIPTTSNDAEKHVAKTINGDTNSDPLFKLDALTFDDDRDLTGCDVSKTTREHVVNDYEPLEDPETAASSGDVDAGVSTLDPNWKLVNPTKSTLDEVKDDIRDEGHPTAPTLGKSGITTSSKTVRNAYKIWKDKPTTTPRVRTGFLPKTTNKRKVSPKRDQTANNKTTETRTHTSFPPVKNNVIQNTKDSKLIRRAGIQNKEKTDNKHLVKEIRKKKSPTVEYGGVIKANEGALVKTKLDTEKKGGLFKGGSVSKTDTDQRGKKTSTIPNKSLLPARKQNSVSTDKSSSKQTNRGLHNSTTTTTKTTATTITPSTKERQPTRREPTSGQGPTAERRRGVSLPAISTSRHPVPNAQRQNLNSKGNLRTNCQEAKPSDNPVYNNSRKTGLKSLKDEQRNRNVTAEKTKTERKGSDAFPRLIKASGTHQKVDRRMSGHMASLVIHRSTVKQDGKQKALWKN